MLLIFNSISRYITILLTILYTYCNFRCLSVNNESRAEQLAALQRPMIMLLHFILSMLFLMHEESMGAALFFIAQVLFLLLYPELYKRLYKNSSQLLLNNMLLFIALGLLVLERLDPDRAIKQFSIILLSAFVSLPVPLIIDRIWSFQRIRLLFSLIGIGMLFAVLIIGVSSYGARMSISIMGFSFQASELVKLSFVFSAAGFLLNIKDRRAVLTGISLSAVHIFLLVLCKDLGSALIYFLSFLFMLYIASGRPYVLSLGAAATALAGTASYFLFSHVRTRIFAWLNPWADISNRGYQIAQSLFAIGTGGLLGLGLYRGMPNKIPIVEKDFIISAISEELGAVTAVCLVLVCLGCFMQMLMIASDMEQNFYRLIAVGLGIQYIIQVFLTVGGAVKFIPSTGVTLPFVSYGGSSLIASFLLFSVIQSLYIIQGNEDDAELSEELFSEEGCYTDELLYEDEYENDRV